MVLLDPKLLRRGKCENEAQLSLDPFPQGRHALLQLLEREFERGRAGDPDEIGSFIGPGEMTTINLPHPAAKLSPLGGRADPLRREESHGAGAARRVAGFHCVMSVIIERHEPVADPAALVAGGVKDHAAPDDARAGEGFGLTRISFL